MKEMKQMGKTWRSIEGLANVERSRYNRHLLFCDNVS